MNMDDFNQPQAQAAQWLRTSQRIVAFTGAGISAESGIPTFRDSDGFWREFPPEQFAHWRGLIRTAFTNPVRLAAFVRAVIEPLSVARPNDGHLALRKLEQHRKLIVVTQNIDGLHQAAGNGCVLEVHGSLSEITSLSGKRRRILTTAQIARITRRLHRIQRRPFALSRLLLAIRPMLGAGLRGMWRPNVVLFGEGLAEPAWSNAVTAVENCDCLLTIGTSGLVYPAAMLPAKAEAAGAKVIHIDPTEGGTGLWLRGNAGDVLPPLIHAAFEADINGVN